MVNQNYSLISKRLGFRSLCKEDIKYLQYLDSDPDVRQYFPVGVLTKEEIEKRIEEFLDFQVKGLSSFVIFELETGEFIGRSGFGFLKSGEIEIGYVLHKKFWNKGYATEILSTLLNYAKKNHLADYIVAYAVIDNIGSFKVMEKCGMQYYKSEIVEGVECKFYKKNL